MLVFGCLLLGGGSVPAAFGLGDQFVEFPLLERGEGAKPSLADCSLGIDDDDGGHKRDSAKPR